MKKETGLAIGLGVLFGLVFSFVIILNTQTNKAVTQKKQMAKSRPAVESRQSRVVVKQIEVTSPNDRAVFENASATVRIKVEKNSFIVIQTPSQDIAFENESENVAKDVPLSLGENIIHISVYSKAGGSKIQEKELRVYYLPTT
jgi:hypothetical protein